MKDYIDLLRIPQYSKNFFIFLPCFFAMQVQTSSNILNLLLVFLSFCSLASSVYIFNDLCDLTSDRLHPKKKYRALPAGKISQREAIILMIALLSFGLAIAYLFSLKMLYLYIFYAALNVTYSIRLKHIPIIDIIIIAVCFVIRIFVGGEAGKVPIYMWIVIMTFLLALFLALGKRRDDVIIFITTNQMPRKSIDGYNLRFVDASMVIMAAVTLVAYLMYTVSPDVIQKFGTDKLYLTSLFVLIGIMRYLQITMIEEESGNPTDLFLKDIFIQGSVIGWLISFIIILYC